MGSERIITVFGSSRAAKNSRGYKEAYQTGKLLAEAGFIVCNGGYGGTMAASAKGAKEAGGQTIGVTVNAFRKANPNEWIDIESRSESSMERLMVMVSVADAFLVLRGGIGTLAEMAFVWSSIAVGELQKPVILVGKDWQKAIDALSKHLMIRERDEEKLYLVGTPEEAVKMLDDLIPAGESSD